MLGTIVNAGAIIVGGICGILLKKGIRDSYRDTIMQGLGLSVLVIGLMGALETQNILLLIFSIVIGSIIGEAIKIQDRLDKVGELLEARFGGNESTIAKGFVTASLLFCVGAWAIIGALESGLTGNHETLFAKALLDGVSSVIFASTLGVGVIFSAVPLFIYQGFITIGAAFIEPFLVEHVITEMSAIGSMLIMGIAINILEIKRIKVVNMLPAVFVPLIYYMVGLVFPGLTSLF